jgi:hypothetical protein
VGFTVPEREFEFAAVAVVVVVVVGWSVDDYEDKQPGTSS